MSTPITHRIRHWLWTLLLAALLTLAVTAAPTALDQIADTGLTPAAYACPNAGGGGDC